MGWDTGQWDDRIRAKLGDLGVLQLVQGIRIPLALEAALAIYSNDNPRTSTQTFAGDGTTYDFDLTADAGADPFDLDWSRVTLVEYPTGERTPKYLEAGVDWVRLHGTGTVRLLDVEPATGESVAVSYYSRWPFPTGTAGDDPIPEVHAHAVASLAAAEAIHAEAAARAKRHDSSVMTTLVESNAEALMAAAKTARRMYTDTVLGRPPGEADTPPQVAYAETAVDTFPSTIFHTRRRL